MYSITLFGILFISILIAFGIKLKITCNSTNLIIQTNFLINNKIVNFKNNF